MDYGPMSVDDNCRIWSRCDTATEVESINLLYRWVVGRFQAALLHDHRFWPQETERKDAGVYSAEAGVYPVVNKVMRKHDGTKVGFRPYVRSLHDTLSNPIPPMFRWVGTCYRWMKLLEGMVTQYDTRSNPKSTSSLAADFQK